MKQINTDSKRLTGVSGEIEEVKVYGGKIDTMPSENNLSTDM